MIFLAVKMNMVLRSQCIKEVHSSKRDKRSMLTNPLLALHSHVVWTQKVNNFLKYRHTQPKHMSIGNF